MMHAHIDTATARPWARPVKSRQDCWAWEKGVTKDARLTPMQRLTARALADRHNHATGRCDPSLERLADDVAGERAAVSRALKALELAGWIRVGRACGRGRSNAYVLTLAQPEATPEMLSDGQHNQPAGERDMLSDGQHLPRAETLSDGQHLGRNVVKTDPEMLSDRQPNLKENLSPPFIPPSGDEADEPDDWHAQQRAKRSRERGLSEKGQAGRSGPASTARTAQPARVFVKAGTAQWDAWQLDRKANGQRGTPCLHSREHGGEGWWFPSQWPPGTAHMAGRQALHA